jgi:hypothetical protein
MSAKATKVSRSRVSDGGAAASVTALGSPIGQRSGLKLRM